MRLRKKPWITEAILEFKDFVFTDSEVIKNMSWTESFENKAPLQVELGTGKGTFITTLAQRHPDINFIGIEAQQDVLYYAAKEVAADKLPNVKLLVFDINHIMEAFANHSIERFYINFCDPWPKPRHAKRRLTHQGFLEKYQQLLTENGQLFFKTDNKDLFDFSLEQFSAAKLKVDNVTFDLHNSNIKENIMTEYEVKFSNLGQKINFCEVTFNGK